MSASVVSPFLSCNTASLQFTGLFVRLRSLQRRGVCQVRFLCRIASSTQYTRHRPVTAVVEPNLFRATITHAQLPRLSPGVRWFSGNEDGKTGDAQNSGLKGFVVRVPNPLGWLKNTWFTYRIQSLVDSSFNLREFQMGAKHVC